MLNARTRRIPSVTVPREAKLHVPRTARNRTISNEGERPEFEPNRGIRWDARRRDVTSTPRVRNCIASVGSFRWSGPDKFGIEMGHGTLSFATVSIGVVNPMEMVERLVRPLRISRN